VRRGKGLYTYELLSDVHERWNSGQVEASSLQSSSRKLRGDGATYQSYTGAAVPGTWKIWVIEKFEFLLQTARDLPWMHTGPLKACSS
jgi:hypothetical protein